VGGFDCKPVSVELTYGLERITMFLQNVNSVYDIEWAPGVTYGQIHHRDEVELSTYNFEIADTDMHFKLFDMHEKEAFRAFDANLYLPGYESCLKCSHYFNMLDARGAISTTERQNFILRVRALAQKAAEVYLKVREEIGFPLLKKEEK